MKLALVLITVAVDLMVTGEVVAMVVVEVVDAMVVVEVVDLVALVEEDSEDIKLSGSYLCLGVAK